MNLQTRDWESPLLLLAYEAKRLYNAERIRLSYEQDLLERAYSYCEELTRLHSRSFFLASRLLPPEKQQAIRALYAFCRTTDDIVDRPHGDVRGRLDAWRQRALTWTPPETDVIAVAWADARARYHVPRRYAEQLIDGVARDLCQTRYNSFAELTNYCYGVASTVGLMSMHIIGFESDEAIPYAVKLGVALQLTNILRDVGEDWQLGRLYLPREELEAFGLTEDDIGQGIVDDRWRAFMSFQISRARRLYNEAWPGIRMLAPEGRLSIGAAADFYRAILDDIEAHDYDVFSRRAYVSKWGKLRRLPGIWWRTR